LSKIRKETLLFPLSVYQELLYTERRGIAYQKIAAGPRQQIHLPTKLYTRQAWTNETVNKMKKMTKSFTRDFFRNWDSKRDY
jgi:hypothetical protein